MKLFGIMFGTNPISGSQIRCAETNTQSNESLLSSFTMLAKSMLVHNTPFPTPFFKKQLYLLATDNAQESHKM